MFGVGGALWLVVVHKTTFTGPLHALAVPTSRPAMATRAAADVIFADNLHHANEISTKLLDRYHSMLNSFNLQATLIVGFAISSINHDNMNAIISDASRYCLYKAPAGGFGFAFVTSTVICVSVMLTCIAASFYIELRSQHYALHVGVREAVAMVRTWMKIVIQLYGFGMACFIVATSEITPAPEIARPVIAHAHADCARLSGGFLASFVHLDVCWE